MIEKFNSSPDAYLNSEYNETQTRQEFINPFFVALGWDVDNKKGYSTQFREVFHEGRVKVLGKTKNPDYSFSINGNKQFFCEAKRPSVNIAKNPDAALQIRRYGWSAKHFIGVLTDFQELAIYNTQVRPEKSNLVETARLEYFNLNQYEENWATIYGYLSKKAILDGSLIHKQSKQKGKGSRPVDEEFLKNIENWRELLAKDMLKNSPPLLGESAVLTEAVQRLLDRIVFLRIAEDRGLETFANLKERVLIKENKLPHYHYLKTIFREADQRYNSGLFHFHSETNRGTPDTLIEKLEINDKVFLSSHRGAVRSALPDRVFGHACRHPR